MLNHLADCPSSLPKLFCLEHGLSYEQTGIFARFKLVSWHKVSKSGLLNLSSTQLESGHLDEGVPPPPPDSEQEDPVPIGERVFFPSRYTTDLESVSYSHRFSPANLNSSLEPYWKRS